VRGMSSSVASERGIVFGKLRCGDGLHVTVEGKNVGASIGLVAIFGEADNVLSVKGYRL
jgi:hypothetical protein